MSNLLRIREGCLVSFEGFNWIIVHVEDTQRVLASRTTDRRHEFLPIEGLKPAIGDAGADASDASADETGPPPGSKSTYYKRIVNRTIRTEEAVEVATRSEFEAIDKANHEFHAILEIIETPKSARGPLIDALCKQLGVTPATVYRRMSLVKVHGVQDVLSRPIRSDKGKRRLSEDVVALVNLVLAKHRFISTPETLSKILTRINGLCRRKSWPEISAFSLQSIEKETSLKQKLLLQGRPGMARDLYRPKVGHLPNADYPLAIVQIDHTPIQVILVDEEYRQPISSPILSLVIDSYSRMVLGFFLSFDGPGALNVGIALAHAFLPKEEYLRKLGVPGEWPCWGIPDVIQVDNGADLNGKMMHEVRRKYRVVLRNRPVGSPNFGGHVESAFRTFLFEQKGLPGTKFSNPQQRGAYRSEDHAVLTLSEFEQYFTEFLVNDYHLNPHSGEGINYDAPLKKWKQGIFEGDIHPPLGLPDRPIDELSLKISLLPIEKRTISNSVVHIFGGSYYSGELTIIGDNLSTATPLEQRQFEIRYDPRDVSLIWFLDPRTGKYIELRFTDTKKPSISLWDLRARNKMRGQPAAEFADERFTSIERRDDMMLTAKQRTKKQRKKAEIDKRRAEGALSTPAVTSSKPAVVSSTMREFTFEDMIARRNKRKNPQSDEPNK